jgi:ankyrin repeat protein
MLAAANLYSGEQTLTPLLTALRMWQMQQHDANPPLNALRQRDSAGYTALHYAAGCGNADGIAALLQCERALVQQQRQQQYRGGYLSGYNISGANRYSSPVRTSSVTAAIAAVAADVSGSSSDSKSVVNLADSPPVDLTAASSGSPCYSDRDTSSSRDDAAAAAALAVAAAAEAEEAAAAAVAELPWPMEPSLQSLVNIAASKAENCVTALHLAAVDGHVEAVKALLQRGASPHRADAAHWTPIYYAATAPTKSTSSSSSSSSSSGSSSNRAAIGAAATAAASNKEAVVLELFKVEPRKQLQDLGRALSSEESRANTYVASVMRCIAALPDFYDQVSHATHSDMRVYTTATVVLMRMRFGSVGFVY